MSGGRSIGGIVPIYPDPERQSDLEQILSLAKKHADEAEVFLNSFERTRVVFEANQLKQLTTTQASLVTLRLVKDGRIGFSVSTGLHDREAIVNRALNAAHFGPPTTFDLPSKSTYPQIEVYDPDVEKVPVEDMVNLGGEFINQVREHTPELVCEAMIGKTTSELRVINSRGGDAGFKRSHFGIQVEGVLIRNMDMLFVGDADSSCHPITKFQGGVQEITRQLEWAKRQASVPSGRLPVILTPVGVASALVPALCKPFNGSTVVQGASLLQNRQGEQVFENSFSLHDDATVPFHPRSRPCDDEGIPSQRTTLVEQGVVGNFLYDLHTAGLANTQSTGNGKREGGVPSPKESALIIDEGKTSFEDMLMDMQEGLVVEMLMGASQTNILGGDFSGNVLLGYRVEKGEIVGRVKNVVLSGNIYSALSDVVIGRDSRWLGGAVCTPSLYLSNLVVVSRE